MSSKRYIQVFARVMLSILLTGCTALIIIKSNDIKIDGEVTKPLTVSPSSPYINIGSKNIYVDSTKIDTIKIKNNGNNK